MRTASLLTLALLSACASVSSNRIDSKVGLRGANAPPARYLSCGQPTSENKLRCAQTAAQTCPGGFTVSGPYPDLPHLVYACN
jgi:hypothetical protein